MKIYLLLIPTLFSLFSASLSKETEGNKIASNNEPPDEVKLVFERYGDIYNASRKITASEMNAKDLKTLNDYLRSTAGSNCTILSWDGRHACDGVCPSYNSGDTQGMLKRGILLHTTCGTQCLVYCSLPGGAGC